MSETKESPYIIHPEWEGTGVDEKTIDGVLDSLPTGDVITPVRENVVKFACFPPSHYSIVIIGQDPYPKAGAADGIAFSCSKIQASLRNVYKCLMGHGLMKEMPDHGNLSNWMMRGVLMVNTALTTRSGHIKSHVKEWKGWFETFLTEFSKRHTGRTYLLWGNHAKGMSKFIADGNTILTHCHPSPLTGKKFLSCNHFLKVSPREGWSNEIRRMYLYVTIDRKTDKFLYCNSDVKLEGERKMRELANFNPVIDVGFDRTYIVVDYGLLAMLGFRKLFSAIVQKIRSNLNIYLYTDLDIPEDSTEWKILKMMMNSVTIRRL